MIMSVKTETESSKITADEETKTMTEGQHQNSKGERLYHIYSALDDLRNIVKKLSSDGIYANENISYFGDIILVTVCINGKK